MKKFQRYNEIMNRLHTFKHVNVKELAYTFKVSEETIRRDLEQLEKEGVVQRKHGGASLIADTDFPYAYRATSHPEKKKAIAEKVLPILKKHYSIMADSSSTVLEAIRLLSIQDQSFKVITNSINMLYELSSTSMHFISTGGMLKPDSATLVGSQAIDTIQHYYTDITLLSCRSLSINGASVNGELEGFTKKEMIHQGRQVCLLVDSSKLSPHEDALFQFASFNDIDYIVSDVPLPDIYLPILEHHHVKVL